eukprot:TRINITY_DN6734_c0_g1_i1.p1 TRINITY_DN6734_c0_g1~~TRINITY_DN6734_c0_g1_i1.p1  ORF type:complete len:399 (+),score=84.52 TRINITY_DN6734_c0_g1_i1:589-1785(+)
MNRIIPNFTQTSTKSISKKTQKFIQKHKRYQTNQTLTEQDYFLSKRNKLNVLSRGISVNADSVSVIENPVDFYEEFIARISGAQERIVVSSLYIGVDEYSVKLRDAIEKRLGENKELKVTILVDYLRGTRMEKGSSSFYLLEGLKLRFPGQVEVLFFHTPGINADSLLTKIPALSGWLCKQYAKLWKKVLPSRIIEVVGVQHIKAYVVDNSSIISGANLSEQYYLNRQDRYFSISNKEISDFYDNLVTSIGKFSYSMGANGKKKIDLIYPKNTPHPIDNPIEFAEFTKNKLKHFCEVTDNSYSIEGDTIMYPTVQLGSVGIFQDQEVIADLFKNGDGSTVYIATPYFNIDSQIESILERSKETTNVLVASPKANGFYGSKGVSGYIPAAYSQSNTFKI